MAPRIVAALVLVAAVVLVVVALVDESQAPGSVDSERTTSLAVAPENLGPRKDLVNLDGWLNTEITDLAELDGKVVLVEMWTFG